MPIFKALFVAVALALTGCAAVPEDGSVASVDVLVSTFDRLGLGFGRDDNENGWALKWVSPVRVAFKGEHDESDVESVRRAFSTMQKLTGIPVEIPAKSGRANFAVRFIERGTLHEEAAKVVKQKDWAFSIPIHAVCLAIPNAASNILRADIFVVQDGGERLREICVQHELMHAYGLLGHHQKFRPSILYFRVAKQNDLSVNDMILLRTLYDPRISAGMKRAEALPLSRKIITEMVAKLSGDVVPLQALAMELQW